MTDQDIEIMHPVQMPHNRREKAILSSRITLQAYEVYKTVYSPQPAIIEGNCRGGFGVGELIAFLYAYPFPKEEWTARVNYAFAHMKGL